MTKKTTTAHAQWPSMRSCQRWLARCGGDHVLSERAMGFSFIMFYWCFLWVVSLKGLRVPAFRSAFTRFLLGTWFRICSREVLLCLHSRMLSCAFIDHTVAGPDASKVICHSPSELDTASHFESDSIAVSVLGRVWRHQSMTWTNEASSCSKTAYQYIDEPPKRGLALPTGKPPVKSWQVHICFMVAIGRWNISQTAYTNGMQVIFSLNM